jgi:hypothetical protein
MDMNNGEWEADLATIDPSSMAVSAPHRVGNVGAWPWLAGDGQTLGMIWSDRSGPMGTGGMPAFQIHFAPVDAHTIAGASSATSLPGDGKNDQQLGRLIRTPFGFLAAWEDVGDDNQIKMALLDGSGHPTGSGLVEEPNSGDANWPNMAWAGHAGGVVYYQWRANRPQIFMSFIDATGARVGGLHDVQVSRGTTGGSKYPDVAWTGTEFGVIYVDSRDGPLELWFQRVGCSG